MQQENNNLRFTPSSNEQSPELQKLFADITVQIDNFCQGNTSVPRVLINRFVAGHICHDDIEELPLAFVAPKTKAPVPSRDLTSWQKFVAIQQQNQGASDLGGAGKFAGTSRLALEWQNLTQEERDSFKDTEIVSKRKQKKRKVDDLGVDDGTTIKSHQYNAAMKAFKTNINAMLQNFGTHIILIAVTDTRQTHLYPPVVLPNSDIANEAIQYTERYLLKGDFYGELKRHVDIKGTISQSLREIENAPHSAASVITSSQHVVAEASSKDVMPHIEDARKRMEILNDVNQRFLESYNKVSSQTKIPWMKIIQNPSSKIELVGFPTGCYFAVGKNRKQRRELKLPLSKNSKNKVHFELKLLDKQELLYLELLIKKEELFFRWKE
ncbi:hypothetical protein PS15m_001260 [Mucor circinelloides]